MTTLRLQKFLAQAGIGSRRKCELLIQSGDVLVNGKPAKLGQVIDPNIDRVKIHGKALQQVPSVYYLFYKPKGVLSTVLDPFERATVLDLVKTHQRIYPVGRLDKDSEGLMLLTNDGELAYRLTHPKFQVKKVYHVLTQGIPSEEALSKLRKGVALEDGMTAPCQVKVMTVFRGKNQCLLEMKIHEGKKREIRRMMKKMGHEVISLLRTAIGPLSLLRLKSGEWRPLHKNEVQQLLLFTDTHRVDS